MNDDPTLSLLDVGVTAEEARSEAIERVDRNNDDPHWRTAADAAIRMAARDFDDFTADEVWDIIERDAGRFPDITPSALGPAFLRAAKAGVITKTGVTRLTKNPRRHRDLTVWTAA